MKNTDTTPLFAEERHAQILSLLKEHAKILVPDLCELFQVSPATIRNDLRDLEAAGKLKRTHGGAIPIGKASFEPTSSSKTVSSIAEKKRIAQCAASMIEPGDTIALDAGTTTFEFAKCLTGIPNLTVVTNDIKIALYFEEHTEANIIVIGGFLRHGFECTIGPMALAAMVGLNVDKAFLATNAFSIEKGLTTPDMNQAEMKKALIRSAAETFLLCDSSKIGRTSFIEYASLDVIDHFITDKNISQKTAEEICGKWEHLDFHAV